jgi:hypothetical protein
MKNVELQAISHTRLHQKNTLEKDKNQLQKFFYNSCEKFSFISYEKRIFAP